LVGSASNALSSCFSTAIFSGETVAIKRDVHLDTGNESREPETTADVADFCAVKLLTRYLLEKNANTFLLGDNNIVVNIIL